MQTCRIDLSGLILAIGLIFLSESSTLQSPSSLELFEVVVLVLQSAVLVQSHSSWQCLDAHLADCRDESAVESPTF